MIQHRILGMATGLALVMAQPAAAARFNVIASRAAPDAAGGVYAISPDVDGPSRRALEMALGAAGLRVVPLTQAHDRLVTVRVVIQQLCIGYCVGILSDNYRRYAVVTAQAAAGAQSGSDQPTLWCSVLQSDGLSGRTDDYLPSLLRAGARAYGRSLSPERAPALPRSERYLLPELTSVG